VFLEKVTYIIVKINTGYFDNEQRDWVITVALHSIEVVNVASSALVWITLALALDVARLAVLSASCNQQCYLALAIRQKHRSQTFFYVFKNKNNAF